ncbi:MAG TPA: hypothetical protein DCF33_10455 [Saprospirales bacterium]|nr:hypothetical protein [Saprospirales bacterium]
MAYHAPHAIEQYQIALIFLAGMEVFSAFLKKSGRSKHGVVMILTGDTGRLVKYAIQLRIFMVILVEINLSKPLTGI